MKKSMKTAVLLLVGLCSVMALGSCGPMFKLDGSWDLNDKNTLNLDKDGNFTYNYRYNNTNIWVNRNIGTFVEADGVLVFKTDVEKTTKYLMNKTTSNALLSAIAAETYAKEFDGSYEWQLEGNQLTLTKGSKVMTFTKL